MAAMTLRLEHGVDVFIADLAANATPTVEIVSRSTPTNQLIHHLCLFGSVSVFRDLAAVLLTAAHQAESATRGATRG